MLDFFDGEVSVDFFYRLRTISTSISLGRNIVMKFFLFTRNTRLQFLNRVDTCMIRLLVFFSFGMPGEPFVSLILNNNWHNIWVESF
jgi:hypothetical protein